MFCVERRKAWRMLQSKAGIVNKEYAAQKALLADVDAGKISKEEFFANAPEPDGREAGRPGPRQSLKLPCPHPCDLFVSQGWDNTNTDELIPAWPRMGRRCGRSGIYPGHSTAGNSK